MTVTDMCQCRCHYMRLYRAGDVYTGSITRESELRRRTMRLNGCCNCKPRRGEP